MSEQWLPVTYWHGTEKLHTDERGLIGGTGWRGVFPPIGTGVLLRDKRWRVIDVWMSWDHHGDPLGDGWHVFLAPVPPGDDRLASLWSEAYPE